ncbi:hypothetical protein LCGC14_2635770 [marine sediment metagenome]|uniref:HNH endonuclease n=1 Tax=marine sediment metagenome TaxID=412755 RepID=A0A0F9CRA8_9ZZZZ
MNFRKLLKDELLLERTTCEGRIYEEATGKEVHKCGGGTHMTEVIYTRVDIQHLTDKEKEYFWERRNCALVCGNFHTKKGHTTDFETWWNSYAEKYGDIADYIWGAKKYLKVLN